MPTPALQAGHPGQSEQLTVGGEELFDVEHTVPYALVGCQAEMTS